MIFPSFGKNWYCIAFVLFAFSGLFIQPSNSYAHYDPKGLPPVRVDVELVYLKILDDWDDGVDRDAEIGLGVVVSHGENGAHNTKKSDESWDDWDTDDSSVSNRERRINKIIYSHEQCNPASPVTIAFTVMESDQINTESSWLALGSFLLGLFTTGNPLVGITSAGIGVAAAEIARTNGDDFVGVGIITIPSSGWKFVDIKNNDGRKTGEVYVHVSRTILNEDHEAYTHCKNTEPEPPNKPSIAPFLEEAKKAILNFKGPMGGEPGTEDSKKSEKDARDASFKILLKDLKEVYGQTDELIDENTVVLNDENVMQTKIQMVDVAEKHEKNGQLEDSAETYAKILEMLNEQISNHDKKPTASDKGKPDSDLKPADTNRIISEIEKLTQETSELLDKQIEKREQAKKDKKSKDAGNEDKQALTGLFSASKWLEYANKMVSDALKQSKNKSQESKDGIKRTPDLAKEIKQLNADIKKEAKESKVSQADLNKAAKEPIDKLKSKKQTTYDDKIKEAQKTTEKVTVSLSESAKWIGEILDSDRIAEEQIKGLPGIDPDLLTVKDKEGFFEGDVCEGHAMVTAEWVLVTPDGRIPQETIAIEIDIYDDGKKVPTELYLVADNTAVKIYNEKGQGKIASYDKSMNSDFFYTKYQAKFDPKKGKTVEFKMSGTQRLLPEKYDLMASQFPITVKIPPCKIDSVADDLKVGRLTDQELPLHDKKANAVSKPKDAKPTSNAKPSDKTDKDKTKSVKDTKSKTKTFVVEYDSQTLLGLYTAIKWAEYSQNLLMDAINQYNKELKTQIKQDEQEYANTRDKSIMDAVVEYKDNVKKNDIDLKNLVTLEGKLKDYESEIRKEASKKKILPDDLNKAAEEPINKIELILPETIDKKLKEAEKSEKAMEEKIKKMFEGKPDNWIVNRTIGEQLSVKNIKWYFDGEICEGHGTITVEWNLVGPDGKHKIKPNKVGVYIVQENESARDGSASNTGKIFEHNYKVFFDPKKGTTLEFRLVQQELMFMHLVTIKIPACPIDSVVDDLQPIVVIDQDGGSRKDPPKLVGEITKTADSLKKIRENVKERIDKSERTLNTTSIPQTSTQQQSAPPSQTSTQQSAPTTPPETSAPLQPTQKTVKLVDKNRSAVQHSVDPCLTTHTVWYQFAFNGGYPAGDKITITESGPRGNLVHQGTLDGQGKYQITIQNPPMTPGFEFRLTKYESSTNKLETTLPDIWQFNVGPCVYPGTPGYPSSQPPPEQQSGSGTDQLYFVQMYTINGKNYPIYQFVSSASDSCNDYHLHTSSGKAYAIDGAIFNDPAPSGCGYGKTNSMGFTSAAVYKSQITSWEVLTGINIPEDD